MIFLAAAEFQQWTKRQFPLIRKKRVSIVSGYRLRGPTTFIKQLESQEGGKSVLQIR
jgi:hypothetical protein